MRQEVGAGMEESSRESQDQVAREIETAPSERQQRDRGPEAEPAPAGNTDRAPAEATADLPADDPGRAAPEAPRDEGGEEQTPAAPEATPYNEAITVLKPGDIVKGKVVQVSDNEVLVDVGYKSEGLIPVSELARRYVEKASDVVSVGDEIYVQVLRLDEREEGRLILSKKRAEEEVAWQHLQQAYERGEVLEVNVVDEVKGGLIANVGVRGFIPASQVGQEFIRDLSPYVSKTIRVKIIELDRSDRRVILSEKAVLDEEQRRRRQETWDRIQEGQVWTGTVKRLTDFGAFVEIDGIDGLLHISEMSWGRINHPSEVLKEGQSVDVKVLKVDRERGRISLGLRQLLPDPWTGVAQRYLEGSIVEGKVVRLVNFGAFVELEPGVDGLVHISQLADRRVATPQEVVQVGDQVRVRVLGVNPKERRISLSLKEAQDARPPRPERRGDERRRDRRDRDRDRDREPLHSFGPSPGGVTIGDMVGSILREAKADLQEALRQRRREQPRAEADEAAVASEPAPAEEASPGAEKADAEEPAGTDGDERREPAPE